MFNISTLSEEEKGLIRAWASQGADLQEIQKRVSKDLGHTITYLDTRFLVSDLGIDLVKPSEPVEKEVDDGGPAQELANAAGLGAAEVNVNVDELALPDCLMSGKVTFSDGQHGRWYLDQEGRLGIDPDIAGYQPTELDLEAFRKRLLELAK